MNRYIANFKTVCRHKAIVLRECWKCGIGWQGITHDLSKFSPVEFNASARYFQGDKSPIEAEKAAAGYSAAWLHHKGHNPHHWKYWTDYGENGQIIANKIPYKYVVEMVCDWIGAGIAYNKEQWNQHEPLAYYKKVRDGRHFHPDTENLLLGFLSCIDDFGLDEFHRMARCQGKHAYLAVDYEEKQIP